MRSARILTRMPIAALVAGLGALLAASPALAETPHEFGSYLGAASSTPSNPYPLANPSDVAVDNSGDSSEGDFYVTDPANHRVEKFDSAGNFLLMFGKGVNSGTGNPDVCTAAGAPTDVCQAGTSGGAPGQFATPQWIAVDNSSGASKGSVYVGDSAENDVQKFDSSGQLVTSWVESGQLKGKTPGHPFQHGLRGIAVDDTGTLFVHDSEGGMFLFNENGGVIPIEWESGTSVSAKAGIEVDSEGNVYTVGASGAAVIRKFDREGNILGQFQKPSQATGIGANPDNTDLYVDDTNGTLLHHFLVSCSEECTPVETLGSTDLTGAEGVAVDAETNTIYVADAATGNVATFVPVIQKPAIEGFYASNVTANSADLHATINPNGADTEYAFEYGPTIGYGQSTPLTPIGTGQVAQKVEVHLSSLQALTYHFRVVATNEKGTSTSYDQTFNFYPSTCPNETVRQQTNASTLPDCRAYELASAEDAGTTVIFPSDGPVSGRSTSPSRIAFSGWAGIIPGSGGWPQNDFGDLYVATRTANGWKSKYVGLPANETLLSGGPPWANLGGTEEGGGVSSETADKWNIGVLGNPSLSRILDWNNGEYNWPNYCCLGQGEGIFSSNAPYLWDATTGARVDRWPTNVATVAGGEEFKGQTIASADLSHFVFTSNLIFAPSAEPGDMYDNNTQTGAISIASRAPDGEDLQLKPLKLNEDGSNILMTTGPGLCIGLIRAAPSCGPGELFIRVNDSVTYEVAPGRSIEYIGMTADGSKVFFTSPDQLTSEDTDESQDIYMWSQAKAENEEEPLTLVSAGNEGPAGPGNRDNCATTWTQVCNAVPVAFMTRHGGYPIFEGGLGGNGYSDSYISSQSGEIYFYSPELLDGGQGIPGAANLYVYRNGRTKFVTAMTPGNYCGNGGNGQGHICSHGPVVRMDVSPDGEHVAFATPSKLTSYENKNALEIYTYTPATGEILCASCNPNGEPPTPPNFTGEGESQNVYASQNGLFMTNDGRVFFSTEQSLVPQDTNQALDIYEYVEGRPQLISQGTGAGYHNTLGTFGVEDNPGLVSVSADGTDVYFATYEHLVEQDLNGEELKIYDARSGGGFPFVKPPPGCAAADECHGEGSSPVNLPTNGTGAALGKAGNVQSSSKPKAKKHRAQKRKHRRRHGRRHAHSTKRGR